jgi:hypothetical protein
VATIAGFSVRNDRTDCPIPAVRDWQKRGRDDSVTRGVRQRLFCSANSGHSPYRSAGSKRTFARAHLCLPRTAVAVTESQAFIFSETAVNPIGQDPDIGFLSVFG